VLFSLAGDFYSTIFNYYSIISSPVDVCLAVSALSTNLVNLISLGYNLYILVVVELVSIFKSQSYNLTPELR
jgi:hypothetical protein